MWTFFVFSVFSADWYYDDYGVSFEDREYKVLIKSTKTDLVDYLIPSSVEKIVDSTKATEGPFYSTRESLKSIKFGENSSIEFLGVYCFAKLLIYSIDFTTCSKLKILTYGCLKECSKLEVIKFPPKLEIIQSGALMSLASVTSMEFPPSLKETGSYNEIYGYSIQNCPNLIYISFGEDSNLTKLGSVTFNSCGLTSIYLPKKLSEIGMICFGSCPLVNITVDPNNLFLWSDGAVLYNFEKTTILLVPYIISGDSYNICEGVLTVGSGSSKRLNVKTIKFASTVRAIGSECFMSAAIETINIPSHITSISNNAFANCQSLRTVEFNATISRMEYSMFSGCISLERIIIPSGVQTIGKSAFAGCSNLSYVFVPKTVQTIESAVFSRVKAGIDIEFEDGSPIKLENDTIFSADGTKIIAYIGTTSPLDLKISSKIEIIGESSYNGMNVRLLEFEEGSQLRTIEKYAFQNCLFENIKFPFFLKNITDASFGGCKLLRNVEFNENLEEIGKLAFYNCIKISLLSFVHNVKVIGCSAFSGCVQLSRITIPSNSFLERIGDQAFENTAIKEVSIPRNIIVIGSKAFSGSNLFSIIFNVEETRNWSISKEALKGCSYLKQVYFGYISGIGESSFEDCTGLENINIGWNVESIGINAFKGCDNLETIILSESKSLKFIEGFAFSGCTKLTKFEIGKENERFGTMYNDSVLFTAFNDLDISSFSFGFSNDDKDCYRKLLLFLPNSKAKEIKLMQNTKYIAAYAFEGAKNLERVIIPDQSVIEIGFNGFLNCKLLSYVFIGNSVNKIGNRIFEGCESLGCGSVIYTERQFSLLVGAGVKPEILKPCLTNVFSINFHFIEYTDLIFSGIMFTQSEED